MNYVLISTGIIPEYIKYTINTILSVDKDAHIIIGTDKKTKLKNVEIVYLNDLISAQTQNIGNLITYDKTSNENHGVMNGSLLRIFYLRDLQKELGLDQFIHFDNDVLIYKPYQEIQESFDINKFNITPSSQRRLIFGFSFVPKFQALNQLCESLQKKIIEGHKNDWPENSKTLPNEEDLLGMLYQEQKDLFNLLPNLPYESGIVFDPISYGQYIDGSKSYPRKIYSRRSINFNETVGIELYSKRIKLKFKNNNPIVLWDGKKYELSNLHIKSKRFHKFLPSSYKIY